MGFVKRAILVGIGLLLAPGIVGNFSTPPGGRPFQPEQRTVNVDQAPPGHVFLLEIGRGKLMNMIHRIQAAFAAVSLRAFEKGGQILVLDANDFGHGGPLQKCVDTGLDLLEKPWVAGDELVVLGLLDDGVHQMDRLAGAGGGPQGR